MTPKMNLALLGLAFLSLAAPEILDAQTSWIISSNESKIDLTSGAAAVVPGAEPDSLTFLDVSDFPPKVIHWTGVSNTVIGPPSNVAISPNGKLALIADSLVLDPSSETGYVPGRNIHVLNLDVFEKSLSDSSVKPSLGAVQAGEQPSGISFTPCGKWALVANRAGGSVTVLKISECGSVNATQTVDVCDPALSASDVAIHPNGGRAYVSVQKGGYLLELDLLLRDGELQVQPSGRQIGVFGSPYRCVFTPDGEFLLTAGQGAGNALDEDALSIIAWNQGNPAAVNYLPVGSGPETVEVSPDGSLIAVALMNGSNKASNDPLYRDHGLITLVSREGSKFNVIQRMPTGRIPEGIAFASDGSHLAVQCHPDKEIRFYPVEGKGLEARLGSEAHTVQTPGFPSGIRASR